MMCRTLLVLGCLLFLWLIAGCEERGTAIDADVALVDAVEVGADTSMEDTGDVASKFDETVTYLDRPAPMDGPVEGIDATTPDEGAASFVVGDGCTVPRFGGAYDAGAPCTPGRTRACACSGDRRGAALCEYNGLWGDCVCSLVDAGITVEDGRVIVPERPIPWIGRPRLLAPQSGMRVTSQRPTLRWMLPSGIDRARVELCTDRPCARMLAQQEVRADRWRPSAALPAGVVFWRVRGLDSAGAVRWTSATWEFGVRHRDLGVDTSYGVLKDFNGDGYDDVVTVEGLSKILVYPGSAGGLASGPPLEIVSDRDERALTTQLVALPGIGDFNGDGLSDLALGSIGLGQTYVHFGSRTCTLARTSGVYRASFFPGNSETSAVSAGDFNGDGYADFITNSYRMQLYLGGPTGPVETPADISELTSNYASFVGDINGDGYQDILSNPVGPNVETEGLPLLVLYGNPNGRLDFHVERILDPRIGSNTLNRSYFGFAIRWSDLNEDGYTDALVSVPAQLYVYYGSPAGFTRVVRPQTTELSFGGSLYGNFGGYFAHPADIDGDGHAELLIGNISAPGDEVRRAFGPGRLYVFTRNPTTGLTNTLPALTIAAPERAWQFGKVATPGDLNGDGYDDVVVGASYVVPNISSRPRLHVYYGGGAEWWHAPVSHTDRAYGFNWIE
jgi:hypothetical protein